MKNPLCKALLAWKEKMKDYIATGHCRFSGDKRTIKLKAESNKHAKAVAYWWLTRPKVRRIV